MKLQKKDKQLIGVGLVISLIISMVGIAGIEMLNNVYCLNCTLDNPTFVNTTGVGGSSTTAHGRMIINMSSTPVNNTISGLSFTPSFVEIYANSSTSNTYSNGWQDISNAKWLYTCDYTGSCYTTDAFGGSRYLLYIASASATNWIGNIVQWNSDGFVLNFTKANNPTGTMIINWIAHE